MITRDDINELVNMIKHRQANAVKKQGFKGKRLKPLTLEERQRFHDKYFEPRQKKSEYEEMCDDENAWYNKQRI